MSIISIIHYFKLVFRSLLLLAATALYVINRQNGSGRTFGGAEDNNLLLFFIWLVFVLEMILRFFPSEFESMGCQKQFRRNYAPLPEAPAGKPRIHRGVLPTLLAWLALNGTLGALYYTGALDGGILLLVSLFYAVCDMICILFFCPFQTWFLKNKCCSGCRIYNWDYAMMFTPLVFLKNPFSQTLVLFSLVLLFRWEWAAWRHPERFSESHNACLSCKNCPEKLCHHKRQLHRFWMKNRARFPLPGSPRKGK